MNGRSVNSAESDGNIMDRIITMLSSLFQEKYGNSTISGVDLFQNLCGAFMFNISVEDTASNIGDMPHSTRDLNDTHHALKLKSFSSSSAVENEKRNRKNADNHSTGNLYRNSDIRLESEVFHTLLLSQCVGCLTNAVQRLAACVASFPVLQRVQPIQLLERELQKCVDRSMTALPHRTPHSAQRDVMSGQAPRINPQSALSAKVSDPHSLTGTGTGTGTLSVAQTALELFDGFLSMVNQSTSRCISR